MLMQVRQTECRLAQRIILEMLYNALDMVRVAQI